MSDRNDASTQPLGGEVFVLWTDGGTIRCIGTDCPLATPVPLDASVDPLQSVTEFVHRTFGTPRYVHSTSWRHAGDRVVLTFVAVLDPADAPSVEVQRTEISRGDGTQPPQQISVEQVLEHAIRHLAWLAAEDPAARRALADEWPAALAPYEREPFRSFHSRGIEGG